MLEAKCSKCHETFIPDSADDLIHGVTENGTECGGTGTIVGADATGIQFIPMDDLTTVRDRDAWTSTDQQTFTNAGIYGWKIIKRGKGYTVTGVMDGIEGHQFGKRPTFEAAMELVAYCLGA